MLFYKRTLGAYYAPRHCHRFPYFDLSAVVGVAAGKEAAASPAAFRPQASLSIGGRVPSFYSGLSSECYLSTHDQENSRNVHRLSY